MTAAARVVDPTVIVWRGDLEFPPGEQGVKIFGAPLGHTSFVRSQLATLSAKHDQQNFAHPGSAVRMDSVVVFRFGSRELHFPGGSLKVVSLFLQPNMTQHCVAHCVTSCQHHQVPCRDVASLPFNYDCLEMIAARNPSVADMIVTKMDHEDAGFHVSGAAQVREQLVRAGFDVPNWQALRAGLRPPGQQGDERQVGIPDHGRRSFNGRDWHQKNVP